MKPLLRAMFLAPTFRDSANRGALIKSPVELIVGTVHMLGLPVPDRTPLVRMMAGLGQSPFDPPNVKGWPGGESWITTSTLLLRQQFLRRIIEATTVWSLDGNMMHGGPNRRAGGWNLGDFRFGRADVEALAELGVHLGVDVPVFLEE